MGGAAVVALASVCAADAFAQETTGSMRGQVVSDAGGAIGGASVTVLDTRTNTAQTSTTDAAGGFSARGLRVGGPYTVIVTADGFAPEQIEEVQIGLGATLQLSVALDPTTRDTIVVTADRSSMVDVALGPAATFTLEDLETAPAINRSIVDVIRFDPRIYVDEAFVDAPQCAGANPRFNSLTVDGVRLNDGFGLNSNGFPTERSPFSFDAIEQVAVELAPFDVQYGGFSACNINAVTKSGANEFFGGAFVDYTSDALTGGSLEGQDVNVAEFDEIRYGFNVGGPIVRDRLFFFAAYEKLEGANTFDRGPEGSGAVAEVAGFTQAEYDRIVQIANDVYNYDPGGTPSSFDNEDEKFLVKIDWNITNNHRANFTYNYNDGFNISESDSDANEFEFENHLYERGAELNSYVGSLFSDWTDNFSTEVRVGYVELDNRQISVGGTDFGEVIVREDDFNFIYLGGDDSRQSNKLNYEVFNLALKGNYTLGAHDFTFGYEREALDIFNLFVQHTEGQIEFNSIDFFEQGVFDDYDYANAPSGDPNDAAAEWGYAANTIYGQDEWSFDNGFTLVLGLRYDWYTSDDVPPENPEFLADYGFSNSQNLDGADLIQPRLGFQWEVNDQLSLRGGVGLYSGGNPNVWLSNNYSANNVTQFTVNEGNLRDAGLYIDDVTTVFDFNYVDAEDGTPGGPGYGVPEPLVDFVSAGEGSNFEINVHDPDFDIPSEWKYAFGATYIADAPMNGFLGGEYVLNGDLLWSKGRNTAVIKRLDLEQAGTTFNGQIPVYSSPNVDAFVLTNSDVGNELFNASVSVSKAYDNGLDWTAGYAYSDSEEVQPMTSSVAFSNYNNRAFLDPEEEVLRPSNYNIQNRAVLNVNYEHAFFGDYRSRIGLYGSANEGRPYSFAFDDANNFYGFTPFLDGGLELYVPTGPDDPNVDFSGMSQEDMDAFFAFAAREGLNKYAGGFAPRNAFEGGWWTKFDMKFEQEFPGLRAGDRTAGFIVIDNLTNLINDEWGVLKEASFPRVIRPIDGGLSDDGTQIVYDSFTDPTVEARVGSPSLWSIRVGLRYEF